MTEDEAKAKWCPDYQVATSGGDQSTFEMDNRPLEYVGNSQATYRPTGRINPFACCIGSKCMAWRWEERMTNDEVRTGFCGRAGKP